MKTKIISLALAVACSLFMLTGCGGSKSSNNSMNPTSPGNTPVLAASVSILNFAFSPNVVHLKIGGTVTWTNKDATPHTVTDLGGSFDSGSLATDQTFKRTFATAGTYTYHCTIHSMMASATIVVE